MSARDAYSGFQLFFGDIHNHCGLSYGRGSLDEALRNARLQLDFASVTLHGHWDDMPKDDPDLDYLVEYHRRGFERAAAAWPDYLDAMNAANQPARFVTYPSFEWHSMRYGDHCIYFRDAATAEIFHVAHIWELRQRLRQHPHPSLLIPHHIGYRQGYRGINWQHFSAELSPVVEIMSFHGASESTESEPAFLHAMGPRDYASTAQAGWAQGHVFGVIGSSDDHSAHPGNYGYGLAAVWAEELTRDAIWDAIRNRRAYAVTGDRIGLQFTLNGAAMGAALPFTDVRQIDVAVTGASAIDTIDILRNNRVIHREAVAPSQYRSGPCKARLELGWGERDSLSDWDVELAVEGGKLLGIEPHLRGSDIARPDLHDHEPRVWSHLDYSGGNHLRLRTRSTRNLTVRSAAMQGLTLHIDGSQETLIHAKLCGVSRAIPLRELSLGGRSGYSGGFVSPGYVFHRAVPAAEYERRISITHDSGENEREWYYVRVRQRNGQWAWSSPIWVERAAN